METFLKDCSLFNALEIGTGVGNFTEVLVQNAKNIEKITSIDLRILVKDELKQKLKDKNVVFLEMDGGSLDFKDNTFDTVCLSNTLHEIENLDAFFKEVKRVLKPNGKLILNEMVRDNLSDRQKSHMYIHHLAAYMDTIRKTRYHGETFTKKEMFDILKKYNFINESYKEYQTHEMQLKDSDLDEENKYLEQVYKSFYKRIEEIEDLDIKKKCIDEIKRVSELTKGKGFFLATSYICKFGL